MKVRTLLISLGLVLVVGLGLSAQDSPPGSPKPAAQGEELLELVEKARLDLRILEIEASMLKERFELQVRNLMILREGPASKDYVGFRTGEEEEVQVDRAKNRLLYFREK
jgi:hypothetical protein